MHLRSTAAAVLFAVGCVSADPGYDDEYPLCVSVRFKHDGFAVRSVEYFGPGYCPYALENLDLPVSAAWKQAACLTALPEVDWLYEAPAEDSRRRRHREYVVHTLPYDPERPDDLPVRERFGSWTPTVYKPVDDVLASPPESLARNELCARS